MRGLSVATANEKLAKDLAGETSDAIEVAPPSAERGAELASQIHRCAASVAGEGELSVAKSGAT